MFILLMGLFIFPFCFGQGYTNIDGWDNNINFQLKSFLKSTENFRDRKVAVFDCDGTLLGQSPYYLADEAIYEFAENNFAHKNDSISEAKMSIINKMRTTSNVAVEYLNLRIAFLSGLPQEVIEKAGNDCFQNKYKTKFFPEMKALLSNLSLNGFEIWVLSASPEVLYQQFIHENLGIPLNRILGLKSVISNGKITNQMVFPIPQDEGKAAAIQTFIKAHPLLVCGNSRGDMEMMNESVGMKIIVNPDNETIQKGESAGDMVGLTVKQYWDAHYGLSVYCDDVPQASTPYFVESLNIKENKSNPKLVPAEK